MIEIIRATTNGRVTRESFPQFLSGNQESPILSTDLTLPTSVSVIIPSYNAEKWICDSLASVGAQNIPGLETIVVDDGSTDRSADLVRREFPQVELIRTTNGGHARARNIGFAASHGEFIQFLDADDLLPPNKISLQIERLEQSGADIAYCNWQHLVRQPDGSFVKGIVNRRQIEGDADTALLGNIWFPNHAYLFRREIVERVGGFNESLRILPDVRFALGCALLGARFISCSDVTVPYRIHSASQNSRSDPRTFTRECFKNAAEVEQWWRAHGGVDASRHGALLAVYSQVARASFGRDPEYFELAYQALERLQPGYIPSEPRHLALAARVLGYRRAEAAAVYYRRAKRLVRRGAASG